MKVRIMTKSEKICEDLGKMYFFKEMVKSNLIYISEAKEEKELADIILRVGNFIIPIQIKEKINNDTDIDKWLNNKVYKKAKKQTKETCRQIMEKIKFKDNNNSDILDNIEKCIIIPIIIFDIQDITVKYKKNYISSNSDLLIHVFNIKDFKKMCDMLIAPMEMIRYLEERKQYINYPLLSCELMEKMILVKNEQEEDMILFYIEKYNLKISDENKLKLLKFNTYLSLFEEHCINNKNEYKIFIKKLSCFFVKKIYHFIDRIDLIIEKGNKKQFYWNSYIIDNEQSVLFISLPREKYNVQFITFISNIFMYNFKINSVLSIISYSISDDMYELDFALCEYDKENESLYVEANNQGYSDVWKHKIEDKI